MRTITWNELWPKKRLSAAEATYSRAAKALTQAELALKRIHQPSPRCVAIQAEIREEGRRFLEAETRAQMDLVDSKRELLYEALSNAEMKREETQPARQDALEKKIAILTDALSKAQVTLDYVKMRVGMAHASNAPGPIHSYATLSEAARAICPVHIEKNHLGETYAEIEGVRLSITGDTSLTSIPPSSLNWVLNSNPSNATVSSAARRILSRVVYIEESGKILVRKNADQQVQVYLQLSRKNVSYSYVEVFGSLENALEHYVYELRALESIDISDGKALPLLGEVVRDACRKIAADTAGHPKFPPGQSRLPEGQIHKLVGAYWKAFIDAPLEASIEGSYALLKYRCARGETPDVFAYDTHGHFGFRVRTPDHDWITGEIYCPSGHFTPAKSPDPLVLTNRKVGRDWLAELGPVKFLIKGKTPPVHERDREPDYERRDQRLTAYRRALSLTERSDRTSWRK
jgi:hypothetical protein